MARLGFGRPLAAQALVKKKADARPRVVEHLRMVLKRDPRNRAAEELLEFCDSSAA
jgi:hypothetical protein